MPAHPHHPVLSVVVPVYRSESTLYELYERLSRELLKIGCHYEIILIEDCGGDSSWKIIQELSIKDMRVRGIQFSRNFGQHHGITAGLDFCIGDWVVVMDADLQDRPEEIPRLYETAQQGFDVVLAKRSIRSDHFFKRISSQIFYKVFSYLSDMPYDKEVGNFRIISRKVVNNYKQLRESVRFFGGIIAWMGFSSTTTSIVVQHDPRLQGASSYSYSKLLKLAFEIIIAYSDKPLRLAVQFGFFISSLSFLYGLYIVYRGLTSDIAILGWSSLIVSIYFLGGIIISLLGVLGVYLGKTFDEAKKRPIYIVSQTTDKNHIGP